MDAVYEVRESLPFYVIGTALAEVFVDRVAACAGTYEHDRLNDRLHRRGFDPRGSARECEHADLETAYVHVEFLNRHWPIEFCRTCLTITRGRYPWRPEPDLDRPSWESTEEDMLEDVLRGKWHKTWPAYGKPRRKRTPPMSDWPDTW